jgi:hypothetical protein
MTPTCLMINAALSIKGGRRAREYDHARFLVNNAEVVALVEYARQWLPLARFAYRPLRNSGLE